MLFHLHVPPFLEIIYCYSWFLFLLFICFFIYISILDMIPWFLLREDEDAVLFCHTFPLYKHTSPFCVYTMPMKLPFTAEPHSILSLFLFCTGFSFFVQFLFHLGCHWLRFLFFIFLTPFFIDLIFCLGKTNFFFFKSSDKITHIKQSMFSTLKKKLIFLGIPSEAFYPELVAL